MPGNSKPQIKVPPGLRIRGGRFHYRIKSRNRDWTGDTGYKATQRNVSAALGVLERARQAVKAGQHDRLAIDAKKFTEAFLEFLEWARGEHRAKPATAERLQISGASLRQFFGSEPVHTITAARIERFKTWRRNECKVQEVTIRSDLHALRTFFGYAVRTNWTRENPVLQVKVPSAKDAVRDYVVSPAEEDLYFRTAASQFELDGSQRGPFMSLHDVGRIMLNQGLRPSEIFPLRVEHLDLERGTLRVVTGKTRSAERVLVMTPETRAILAARAAGRIEGWLFPGNRPGTHIAHVATAHELVLRKTGLAFTVYEFRHTFATRFGERVGDVLALTRILGHADLKMVLRYCHTTEAHTAAAMARYIETLKGDGSGTKS